MYDTVRGSDYSGDQDAREYMCETGPEAIIELENMGLPFSRFENGRIYQRPFGGQSKEFGGEQAARTAAAADRTGHALLHLLYQQNVKNKTTVFSEWYALDLVKNQDGTVVGCTAIDIETGEVVYFKSKATVLATGGAGRIFASTTNAHINTGDGVGMALRAGVPVQDMEMWQFHPTGIAGAGTLVTEGCRGEGGYLLNKDGERFMERYAPNAKDLAGRDVVARSMMTEIREGRGCDGPWGPHIKLKLDHLGAEVLESRLPGICELSRTFAHVDPVKEPIPVIPTCHYMMGGIPTNVNGQALTMNSAGEAEVVKGLYACGEIACVSVHGANRLGGNSLLDLVVFGRATGLYLGEALNDYSAREAQDSDIDNAMSRFNRWESTKTGEDPVQIKKDLQQCMQLNFSVFREGDSMAQGLSELKEIRERLKSAKLADNSSEFNTQRIECLELDNLMETAFATAVAANYRTESRGAHSRFDFPDRDDANLLCHSVYDPKTESMSKREVNMAPNKREAFPPKVRTY
jgi:succinate dehydrogenase / fumarate reductase flavoprotein subunit